MTNASSSDALKHLVLFMIALAILGTIIALVLYYAVELPAQQAMLHAPAWNSAFGPIEDICFPGSSHPCG